MKKVLIVDDSSTVRYHIGLMLKKQGFETAEAGNEIGLFNFIEEYGVIVDVIIMDIHLKNENGLELIEKIKSNEKYGQIPIIMITDNPGIESVLKAKSLGVSEFIKKPVEKDMLVDRLNKVLGLAKRQLNHVENKSENMVNSSDNSLINENVSDNEQKDNKIPNTSNFKLDTKR